jgi:hypothetical protein
MQGLRTTRTTVGDSMLQAHPPPSRAGSLPQGFAAACKACGQLGLLWEILCCKPTHRLREQARSHRDLRRHARSADNSDYCGRFYAASPPTAFASRLAPTGDLRRHARPADNSDYCGSEPARDDGGTFNIDSDRHTAFASKPAPTGDLRGYARPADNSHRDFRRHARPADNSDYCGSEPARDDGGTFNIDPA